MEQMMECLLSIQEEMKAKMDSSQEELKPTK
jgi:hypothetical protein